MSEIIIKAESIKKNYDASYALDGIDIEVLSGQILGLIGPNGAGKSTFLQSILGLIKTEGNLEVLGMDPRKDRHQLLKEVCSNTDVAVLPTGRCRFLNADPLESLNHFRLTCVQAGGMSWRCIEKLTLIHI